MRFACRMNHAALCECVCVCVCKLLLLPFSIADVHKAHGLPDVGFAARGCSCKLQRGSGHCPDYALNVTLNAYF